MYVAYTRAKNRLGFIDENLFKNSGKNCNGSLDKVESIVCNILGKEINPIYENKELAKIIAHNIKPITHLPTTSSVILGRKNKNNNLITKKLIKRK